MHEGGNRRLEAAPVASIQLPTRGAYTSIHSPTEQLTHHPCFASRSWTQAEFLCSGHYMPSTPEGAPLSQHASFLPPDDIFMLGADEPKECRRGRGFAKPAAKERAHTITSSEWHVFGGGVPLVRQHSQGALEATNPALLPALPGDISTAQLHRHPALLLTTVRV